MEDSGTNTKINWLFILLLFQKGSFRQLGREKKKRKREKRRDLRQSCAVHLLGTSYGEKTVHADGPMKPVCLRSCYLIVEQV